MAIALAVGSLTLAVYPGLADDARPAPSPSPSPSPSPKEEKGAEKSRGEEAEASGRLVELNLVIGGLSGRGCEVEVKPGNAACRFKKQSLHVGSKGEATLLFRDVELRTVGRNCTFAITIREPGQQPKTVYRGYRMAAPSDASRGKKQSFTCYMNSPSKVAGLELEGRTVR